MVLLQTYLLLVRAVDIHHLFKDMDKQMGYDYRYQGSRKLLLVRILLIFLYSCCEVLDRGASV